jgi:TolB protein
MRAAAAVAATLLAADALAGPAERHIEIAAEPEKFAPGIASTGFSDVRLTISPDGGLALWFSRNRPGGPGGYDIWMSRRTGGEWSAAEPVSFNSATRDFDPAFTADGRYVYFCSDRAGGHGGDDLYRVAVEGDAFGTVENLGHAVNTPRNEWAPMLSADGATLLFSSDGHPGAGGMDLFTARRKRAGFELARALPGALNSSEDEFDATFLSTERIVVFSRARNLRTDAVRLFQATRARTGYDHGAALPDSVNTPNSDTYAPMLDWSGKNRLTFTTRRPADNASGVDVYLVEFHVR